MSSSFKTTLFLNETGCSVGISKGRFVVKKQRKTLFSLPQNHCERVIVSAKSISISSDFVEVCSQMGIGIDFFDRSLKNQLAQLSTPKQAYAKMTYRQLEILNTPLQLGLAKAFLRAKTKNQINYLRYLNKYHKSFTTNIKNMRHIQKMMLTDAKNANALMGFEGQISNLYWQALSHMLEGKVDFGGRRTRGADDIVNASLNYGYAILYGRIHYHALKAGLSLHISYLHTADSKRPTLVYDMIEEFRTFVVDRVVFRMFNQREDLALDEDKRLTPKTQKRIATKILNRLSSKTRYKNSSVELDHIIEQQAYLLARAIKGLATYRGFVGRY